MALFVIALNRRQHKHPSTGKQIKKMSDVMKCHLAIKRSEPAVWATLEESPTMLRLMKGADRNGAPGGVSFIQILGTTNFWP